MRVYFDAQIFFLQKYGGISKYFTHLIAEFLDNPSLGVDPIFHLNQTRNQHILQILKSEKSHLTENRWLETYILSGLSIKTKRNLDVDIVHFTYYLPSRLLKSKNLIKVSTIHDFIPERFFSPINPLRYSHYLKKTYIENSDGLIFVSNFTKQIAKSRFKNLDTKKSSVIHHGISKSLSSFKISHNIQSDYFLYVGDRHSYKNFLFLIRAFSKIAIYNNVNLICFGGAKERRFESKLIDKQNLRDRVIFLNDQTADLHALYAGAIAFINPSLEEGFGLTNLEALANNCPVLCSDIPVFREILGNYGIYFDPYSESSLINKLYDLIINEIPEKKFISLQDNTLEFSWHTMAKKTSDFYKTLTN